MDVWDVLDHPTLISVVFFVLAVVLALAWAMLKIVFMRAKGGAASGVDVAALVTAWRQRPKAPDAVDIAKLQDLMEEVLSAPGMELAGDTKETRVANLEALHAEGRISAEKLAELKAAIASEG